MNLAGLDISAIDAFLEHAVDLGYEGEKPPVVHPVETIAEHWRAWGLKQGELVLLSLPNGVGILRQFFGLIAAGGVPCLIAAATPSRRLQDLASVLHARALVTTYAPQGMSEHVEQFGSRRLHVARFAGDRASHTEAGEVVLLTSGTTGFSSGCVFGLEQLLANAGRHVEAIGQQPGDAVLVNLPLTFSYAFVAQALGSLQQNSRLVVSGPPFHPPSYRQAVIDHGITVSSLTPRLARMLFASGQPLPGGLRVLTVGGDKLEAQEVARLLAMRPPGNELYLTYGLTQAGPRVATLAAHKEPAHRHASVGLPLPGTRTRLTPADGGEQLLVASDTVMRRRLGSVEGVSHDEIDSDGMLRTGDLFKQDEDGYLYFQGRLGDFIVRHGEKVCLAAVRRVAAALPGVQGVKARVAAEERESEFELLLAVDDVERRSKDEYHDTMRRYLRRAEMPREIHLVPANETVKNEYK